MRSRTLLGWVAILGVGAGIALVARRRAGGSADERRGGSPVQAATVAQQRRSGSPADRGRTAAIALDLDALARTGGHEPVVEYLTYIRTRRGQRGGLLFVRREDLDAMAALQGVDTETFLAQLDQVGVIISTN